MTTGKLKKLYEHPMFHGIKTEAEAFDICKAEIEEFGKPGPHTRLDPKNTYIWFLLDTEDKLSSVIYRYCESSVVPFERVQDDYKFDIVLEVS